MIRYIAILGLLLAITSINSCGESYFYNQTQVIDESGWKSDEVLSFPFTLNDSTQKYNLFLDVKHLTDYDYQNLYIKIDTEYPDNKILSDTLSFDFATDIGEWNGKCNGNNCLLRVFLANEVRFKQIGDYKIRISQYSRQDIIKHIKSISFKLQEVEN